MLSLLDVENSSSKKDDQKLVFKKFIFLWDLRLNNENKINYSEWYDRKRTEVHIEYGDKRGKKGLSEDVIFKPRPKR